MSIKSVDGIEYNTPTVILMQETGIGTAEVAARTCYDSFDSSENIGVKALNRALQDNVILSEASMGIMRNIEHSDLLDTLAWTHFHHSILEHASLTYLIKGTSRGVLQEHARHRIQSISVRSTRYTMSAVLNAFVVEKMENYANTMPSKLFYKTMETLDLFVTTDKEYNTLQINNIFTLLSYQMRVLGKDEFISKAIAKSSLDFVTNIKDSQTLFNTLQVGKKKRNVGDAFKHIVNDNWKVDLVVTFNLRSLKNYLDLRDSGAAYFGIRWLAQAMKDVTPSKYLDLIIKPKKGK